VSERRIGVFVCHCGGNISDYVDVDRVLGAVRGEPGVVVAKTAMFACSDATQQEMVEDIKAQRLDGLVVASCSPKLHTFTFRGVARRAGLNPYEYTHVNIREQDSWAHTDDPAGATRKAISLVKAGIARTRLSTPLEPIVVETTPKALIIGAGIAGLRAAIGMADIGLEVVLVEREAELGGWVGRFGRMYPHGRSGRDLIASLVAEVKRRPSITVFCNAELMGKAGSFGNYVAAIRINRTPPEIIEVEVGSIVVATGFETYQPAADEYAYGTEGVVTLPELKALIDGSDGPLVYRGKPVRTLAYIYCVGSRQPGGNEYCSRYCCAAAVHASTEVSRLDASVRQYHLYRDIRTYGKYEALYTESRTRGSVYMKYPEDRPPAVERDAAGRLTVSTVDTLTGGEELLIPVDLVVLVTGMVPRSNQGLTEVLRLPVGSDGFYNEIHPKLRPVETVVDGVLIAGTSQGPKNSVESVASALAAVTQSAAILKRGTAELDPLLAIVNAGACTWCGKCREACPYSAVSAITFDGREVAMIDATVCKGCGACAPVCAEDAVDLLGYTDAQIRALIDGLIEEPVT
jgi:heterodisulfide reductase subunit A